MSGIFKAQLECDLHSVFHNADEFADVVEFWIDGTRYKSPVVLDSAEMQERDRLRDDRAVGVSNVDLVMYVPLHVLGTAPKEGMKVYIGDDAYVIDKVSVEVGEVILGLGRLTE